MLFSKIFMTPWFSVVGIFLLFLQELRFEFFLAASSQDFSNNLVLNSYPNDEVRDQQPSNIGTNIVNHAYKKTFKELQTCPTNQDLKSCMKNLHQKQTSKEKSTITASESGGTMPWWFLTMLRDGTDDQSGLHGHWHSLLLPSPPPNAAIAGDHDSNIIVEMCSLEKVASTEWKKMQCFLEGKTFNLQGRPDKCKNEQRYENSKTAIQKGVFLRDPLERFLSAFLDKCIEKPQEGHCQPASNFLSQKLSKRDAYGRIEKGDIINNNKLVDESLISNKQLFFDAYVDMIPLKWDLHFFPSSLYCDGLFRNVATYDFIGHMGGNFTSDLERFGETYNMKDAVTEVFGLNNLESNLERTSQTSKKLSEYYSPHTVRRVLEYLSIDYVTLGIPIPEWAEEMLRREEQKRP